MSNGLLHYVELLRGIASEGRRYAGNIYDAARYERTAAIAEDLLREEVLEQPDPAVLKRYFSSMGVVTPRVGISAAVPNQAGEILILRRSDDDTWCLPGGWADLDEAVPDTARRECFEECRIDISPIGIIGVSTKGPQTFAEIALHQVNIVVAASALSAANEIVLSSEHKDYRWVSALPDDRLHPGHAQELSWALALARGQRRLLPL